MRDEFRISGVPMKLVIRSTLWPKPRKKMKPADILKWKRVGPLGALSWNVPLLWATFSLECVLVFFGYPSPGVGLPNQDLGIQILDLGAQIRDEAAQIQDLGTQESRSPRTYFQI